ncbi:hypothetical protein JYU29_05110 [Tianweitania sp. BSSL-BM11]|uniref:Uncharacterized protein n=1 Tax=Tianweitania aestuarii TaxID=2814886 RepID=A0ABS5RSN3_9HYPH|nr:hypothetical protein [Tianweitania aestuarii]MBS9720066.1 hypothetical protein [Tianweitania aestuarii]
MTTNDDALLAAMFGEPQEQGPVLTEADLEGEVWERAYEWADGFSDIYGCDHVSRERLTVAFASAIKEASAPPHESFDETVKRFTTFVFAEGDVSIQMVKAHIKQFAEAIRPRVEFDEAMMVKMMERHNEMSAKICELKTQLLSTEIVEVVTANRQTFTVPDGFEAVRDLEGRATGEIRRLT